MLNNIDTIFLDAGGVMLKPDYCKIQQLFPELRLKEEKIDQALYPEGCSVGAGLGPGDNDNQFVYNFALASGIPPELALKKRKKLQDIILFSEWIPRKPEETKNAIQCLKKMNKKIGIVTNTENGFASRQLEKLKICTIKDNIEGIERVDLVVDSWIVGIHKPDPRIYRYAAELIGSSISRCLHIGDSIRNDYDSAIEAGAKALLFRPYEKRTKSTIQSLLDLIQ